MSDQLAAFPLTFNWRQAKQTELTGQNGEIASLRLAGPSQLIETDAVAAVQLTVDIY